MLDPLKSEICQNKHLLEEMEAMAPVVCSWPFTLIVAHFKINAEAATIFH